MRAQLTLNCIITFPVAGVTIDDGLIEAKKLAALDPAKLPWRTSEYLDGDITVTGVFDER